MAERSWKTPAALVLLVAGLAALAYLLLSPGLTPYMAVDQLVGEGSRMVGRPMRLAGYLAGEVQSRPDGSTALRVEAGGCALPVSYRGPLPAQLEPGKEILLDGRLESDGVFHADRLLTQCSSRYTSKLKDREQ